MSVLRTVVLAGLCGISAFLASGCSGGSSGKTAAVGVNDGRARLISVDYGRLVDVYSFDQNSADPNRFEEVLYRSDVVIDQTLVSGELEGTEYILREVDPINGRTQLVIQRDRQEVWDDNGSSRNFEYALDLIESAATKLKPGSYNQNTSVEPFDMMPRNASVRLTFDSDLKLTEDYFLANPGAIQVLEILGNPDEMAPTKAFKSIPVRISFWKNQVILDPVIVGNEVQEQPGLWSAPFGLPASPNSTGANIRVAIPVNDHISAFPIQGVGDVNGVGKDRSGNDAVVRDFRTGNDTDDNRGFLYDDTPIYIVGDFQFGILAVDTANMTLTLNKRSRLVTLRSREEGPTPRPGDMIIQEVKSPKTGEVIRIKAEIDDPSLNDSGTNAVVTVKVNTLKAFDSKGNEVWFSPCPLPIPRNGAGAVIGAKYESQSPLGEDTFARVIFEGGMDDPSLFLTFTPETSLSAPSQNVNPFASVIVNFSEPINPEGLSAYNSIMLANTNSKAVIDDPKNGIQNLIVASLITDTKTAMSVRMVTPLGFNHQKGIAEKVFLLVMAPEKGQTVTDLAGNALELRNPQADYMAAGFDLDKDADTNAVANIIRRFDTPDEDGTPSEGQMGKWGPVLDGLGQYTMANGRLVGARTVRFPKEAEFSTLSLIYRGDKGECHEEGKQLPSPFPLYLCPRNLIFVNPPGVWTGGTQEPFNSQGTRTQYTLREDDFQMSYTDTAEMELDIEQMYWAIFMGRQVQYDVFDRTTLSLSHSERRPDVRAKIDDGKCVTDGLSFASGLKTTFADNVLDHTDQVVVYEDVKYEMNPNNSFTNTSNTRWLSYPKFQTSYTWRDRRLTGWDTVLNQATGLGAIDDPETGVTTDVPSPFFQSDPTEPYLPLEASVVEGAFLGDVVDGMGPTALPLLLDFMTFPDDPNQNGGVAQGLNWHMIGVRWVLYPGGMIPHGYYLFPNGANVPFMRVHSTGGTDRNSKLHLVDPKNSFVATGGWLQDPALGTHQAPAGDCHVHWARADFVRKVSVITFGFLDTTRVSKNKITGSASNGPTHSIFDTASRPVAYEVITEPSLDNMPTGTQASLEWRGVESLPNDDIYDPAKGSNMPKDRGNLLNPYYAADAYRLAAIDYVAAQGFTQYHRDPQGLVNTTTGFGPRYLNWRVIFTNNTTAVPPVSPYLGAIGMAVRLEK